MTIIGYNIIMYAIHELYVKDMQLIRSRREEVYIRTGSEMPPPRFSLQEFPFSVIYIEHTSNLTELL